MRKNKGITYIAFGEEYQTEAVQSAARIAELGDWPLCLITDSPIQTAQNVFDHIKTSSEEVDYKSHRYGGKIKPIFFRESPYDETLYLDTDTYVVDNEAISELFTLLKEYDLAVAHDTHRGVEWQYRNEEVPIENSPPTFPWFNTGVVVYKKNEKVQNLFELWESMYDDQSQILPGINDQSSFTEAVFNTDVNHTVFPEEYNHRTPFQQTLRGQVKILHGHHNNLPEIAKYINENTPHDVTSASSGSELFHSYHHITDGEVAIPTELSRPFRTDLIDNKIRSVRSRLTRSINENGIWKTSLKAIQKIWG